MAMLLDNSDQLDIDIDGSDDADGTPVVCACSNDDEAVLIRLLDAGAKVGTRSIIDMIENAARNSNHHVLLAIRARFDIRPEQITANAYFNAARTENAELMRILLAAGCRGDASALPLLDGQTVCHQVAANGCLETLDLLIAAGASYDATNNRGETPCDFAVGRNRVDIVQRLLQAGCNLPRCRFAVQNVKLFGLLIAAGALWREDFSSMCMQAQHAAIVDFLLAADVSRELLRDQIGLAIRFGRAVPLRRFLAGFARDDLDPSWIQEAVKLESVSVLHVLVSAGATVHAGMLQNPQLSRRMFVALVALGVGLNTASVHFFMHGYGKLCFDIDKFITVIAAGADVCELKWTSGAVRVEDQIKVTALMRAVGYPMQSIRFRRTVKRAAKLHVAQALASISKRQFDLMCLRGFEICVGLWRLRMSALELCEIMSFAFAPLESMVPFHKLWAIATKIKHFKVKDN
jgi:hypothetical protein